MFNICVGLRSLLTTMSCLNLHMAQKFYAVGIAYTYLLTPLSRVLLKQLTSSQLVKKFPAFYGTQRFITTFYKCLPPVSILSQISLFTTIQLPEKKNILILSSHLCLGLSSGFFLSGFPTKTLYTLIPSPIHATCPPTLHLILLDLITQTILGEEYRSLSSSLYSFLHSPLTSFVLGPSILFSTLFSTPSACVPPSSVRDQVSHPYKTRQNYSSVYLNLNVFRL